MKTKTTSDVIEQFNRAFEQLMRVRDGKIVEALAYAKSGDTPVANAVRSAGSPDAEARP